MLDLTNRRVAKHAWIFTQNNFSTKLFDQWGIERGQYVYIFTPTIMDSASSLAVG